MKRKIECPTCGDVIGIEESMKRTERLKRREIYLFDEIDTFSVQSTIEDIKYLESISRKEQLEETTEIGEQTTINTKIKTYKQSSPITLYLNSPGGSIDDGFALIDVIKNSICPIKIIGLGIVASMACAVFVVGSKGMRLISKNTFLMLHPARGGGNDDYVKFQKSRLEQAEEAEKIYDKLILAHSEIPEDIYKKAKDTELWLPANEVIKYKLADSYYTNQGGE